MANRYWVGGSGTWNTTSTTNWSASSGGSSGASVPTSADNVFFDQASTYTVTIGSANVDCADLTVSAGTVTFSYLVNSYDISVYGSFSIIAGTVFGSNYAQALVFRATTTGKTITTNGVTINPSIDFNGSGGGWTLGGALTTSASASVSVTQGTFNTGNFNVTASTLDSPGTLTRTITCGSSTITLSGTVPIDFDAGTNLTFNANTSTFSLTSNSASFDGSGKTFNNVTLSGTASPSIAGGCTFNGLVNFSAANVTGVIQISDVNTFTNLTFAGRTTVGWKEIEFAANQTITGTLTVSAGSGAPYRAYIYSNLLQTARTLTCNAVSLTDVDFSDITIAGAAAPATGTRLGDAKGNSGITFTGAKTVYWNLSGGGNITGTGWATTPTGTPAVNNFPLAQDTAIFSSSTATLSSGGTITVNDDFNFGSFDLSARTTNTMIFNTNRDTNVYGNFTAGSGVTVSGTNSINFSGRVAQTLTVNSATWSSDIVVNSPGATTTISGTLTSTNTAAGAVSVLRGTLSAGTLTVSGGISSTGTQTRSLDVTGTWTLKGVSPWTASGSGLTTSGGGTLAVDNASAKTFAGGGFSYSTLTLSNRSASDLIITGSNTFGTLNNTVSPASFKFTAGTTTTLTTWNISGTSGNLVTVGSVTAASHTLSKSSGTVNADYLSISYSTATGGATWNAGLNSVDGGNNSGWIFGGTSNSFFTFFV